MNYKFFITMVLFFTYNVLPQYITHSTLRLFNYTPTSEIYLGSAGSLGFSSELKSYNPNLFNASSILQVGLFSLNGVFSSRYFYESYPKTEKKTSSGNFLMAPNFFIQYKTGIFLFGLTFYNSVLFNRKILQPNRFEVSSPTSGDYVIDIANSHLNIRNDVLQFFISKKIWEHFSLTFGFLTNSYNYKLDINNETNNQYEIYSRFFTNQQFLFSVNYVDSSALSFYILYKTQQLEKSLDPEQLKFSNTLNVANYSKINYPSALEYGLQINKLNPINISIEMQHVFILKNGAVKNNNTIMAIGLNYRLNDLLLGAVLLYKTKIDPFINQDVFGGSVYGSGIRSDNNFNLLFNSVYNWDKTTFSFGYQISKLGAGDNYKDISHYILLGLSYNIL